ncbi:hypothetical protein [Nocardioides stalactiti]|uniref:hypothetical protein n=1 Tax=Nocardioides stalactiti TaxID=2755356 RepID=UPI0016014997|nr:hypothetical protein [Nocardioides stalactiti]
MRTVRLLLAVLLPALAATLGLVVTTAGPAAACSCVGGDVRQFARWADVVFTGFVAEADDREQKVVYTFEVERVYDGEASATERVVTGNQGSACGLPGLQPGRRYAVYAGATDAGVLSMSSCGGTRAAGPGYVDRIERNLGAGTTPAVTTPAGDRPEARDDARDTVDDAGTRWWVLVVAGTAGAVIVGGLAAGAVRTRRRA